VGECEQSAPISYPKVGIGELNTECLRDDIETALKKYASGLFYLDMWIDERSMKCAVTSPTYMVPFLW
jgi:hypothetical protein